MDLHELSHFFRPPTWATGHIGLEDAIFLDRMVVKYKPEIVIEVGVASGCSSALLLRSLSDVGQGGRLYSFDLAENCYFDVTKAVGAAVEELVPELMPEWELNTGCIASDAASQLRGRDVGFSFIDAYHRHPWPTFDVWALLPVLASGSWVALHDIALARVTECKDYGPEILFAKWPGEKISSEGSGNIGAIRLPESKEKARQWLVDILKENWETGVDPMMLDRLEIPNEVRPTQSFLERMPNGLDRLIADLRMSGRELVIWGAGAFGRKCLDLLIENGIRPDAFVDRDKSKQNLCLSGLPVLSVESFFESEPKPFVLIASMYYSEISDELCVRGLSESSDYYRFVVESYFGDIEESKESTRLLGMTTIEEQNYLFDYASSQFSNKGVIVDLGSWLGSTTIPLARGLEVADIPLGRCIQSYDTFLWGDWMNPFSGELSSQFQPGDSFLIEFQRRIGRLAARVQVRPCDLTQQTWEGEPIEFLLIDAMKSWELCAAINQGFLTAVLPEIGLFMHQDFKFWGCPWIHLCMYRMRDHWELEQDLPNSAGTVFRLLSVPRLEQLVEHARPESYSREEIETTYSYWFSILSGPLVEQLRYARLLALTEIGELDTVYHEIEVLVDEQDIFPKQFVESLSNQLPALKAIFAKQEPWDESLRRSVVGGRAVFVWGGGSGGAGFLRRHEDVRKLAQGVVDSDLTKSGSYVEGILVSAPSEVLAHDKERPFIIIATSFVKEVVGLLNSKGWVKGTDYCVAELT